jgi:hypothetical protein
MNNRLEGPKDAEFDSIDVEAEDVSKIANDVEAELNEILSEIDADENDIVWKVSVSRDADGNAVGPHLFDCSIGEVEGLKDRLRTDHGSGKYQVRIYRNKKLYRRKILWIEAPHKKEDSPQQNSDMKHLSEMMREQNQQMMNFLSRSQGTVQPQDPMAMFTAMLTAMSTMKDVFATPQTKDNSIELVLKGVELAKEVGGSDGGKSIYDVIGDVLKSPLGDKLANEVGQLSARRQPSPAQAQIAHNPKEIKTDVQPTDKPLPEGLKGMPPQFIAQIEQQIKFWAVKATSGSHPALYAELAVDNYEPEVIAAIVNRPDLQEIAEYFVPEINNIWPWFEEMRAEINHILTEGDEIADNGNEMRS